MGDSGASRRTRRAMALLAGLALAASARAGVPAPGGGPSSAREPLNFGVLAEIGQAGETGARRVYHGAMPAGPEQWDFLLDELGVRTVVSLEGDLVFQTDVLRERHEIRRRASAGRAVRFVHVPLHTGHPDAQLIERALALVADPANQPVYFHCHMGADRTQLLAGLFRVRVLGQPPDLVRALMGRHDFLGEAGGDSAAIRRHTCAALGVYWDEHHGPSRVAPGYEGHEHDLNAAPGATRAPP